MTLFPADPFEQNDPEFVQVQDTHVGKGVFAVRGYPETAVIGKITGRLIFDEHHGSEYSFEYQEGIQLEPEAPFRFLNHSCDPNCEFDLLDEPVEESSGSQRAHLHLIALRTILPGEELTIDYNWPACSAITCECGSTFCRGWVVSVEEIELITSA